MRKLATCDPDRNSGFLGTKVAAVNTIVKECELAIEKYNLDQLLRKAKNGVNQLEEFDKEMLTFGLVKLGEALTFCRNEHNELSQHMQIISYAISFANVRNHLVHHQMYHSYFELNKLGDPYSAFRSMITGLPQMSDFNIALNQLKNSGLLKLTKPIKRGANNFPFPYSHYLTALEQEFLKLNNLLKQMESEKITIEAISNNIQFEASLENRIRNILAIMVDLTDEKRFNLNKNNVCASQKNAVSEFNIEFVTSNTDFDLLFNNIREYRNSLCHLDNRRTRPYSDTKNLLEFARQLTLLNDNGYVKDLTSKLSTIQDKSIVSLREFASASSAFLTFKQTTAGVKRKQSQLNTFDKSTLEEAQNSTLINEKRQKLQEDNQGHSLVDYSNSSSGEENANTAATTSFKLG